MRRKIPDRTVDYEVLDGCLVRIVAGSDGRGYVHRCSKAVYEAVAHAIDEVPIEGVGIIAEELAVQMDLPFSQVSVAFEFLKDRGLVVTRRKRSYPVEDCIHLDAMVEYHALHEEPRQQL